MATSTTIQVSFGSQSDAASAANAHLSAEIDDRPDGLNGGKTSFKPGDTAWFLVYKSTNVNIASVDSSAGTLSSGQAVTGISKVQDVTFSDSNEGSLQVPATSISATKWLGRSLGVPSLQGNMSSVSVPSKGVAVAKITYLCDATAYSITSPATLEGETSFTIAILVLGELVVA